MSRSEMASVHNFAPAYFDYIMTAVKNNQPTVIAKIIGETNATSRSCLTTCRHLQDWLRTFFGFEGLKAGRVSVSTLPVHSNKLPSDLSLRTCSIKSQSLASLI